MTEISITPTAIGMAALMRMKGVGRRAALKIINQPLPSDRPCEHLLDLVQDVKLIRDDVAEAWRKAEDDLLRSAEAGIRAFSFHDEGYPERLRNIPDPPAILYVKGSVSGLYEQRCLAVVGTREPTAYGEKVARRSAASAVDVGYAVVSGLAYGCDTLGHEGCLDRDGIGVAVMAHGLDKVYPAANRGLANRLVEAGGCLVSEYPMGMTPMRTAFAERDRIQSGLSDAVLVIETDVKGGTMHTVRFSREQKRVLACIEHPAAWRHEEKTKGNQMMIADRWATPIADGEALLNLLRNVKDAVGGVQEPPARPAPRSQISMGF
jgi:DNA processing protein